MKITQFIKVGSTAFSVEDVCRRLGIDPVNDMKLSIGQTAVGGTLEASVTLGNPEDCPCVEAHYCPHEEPPILLSHVEQDVHEKGSDGALLVRTFLYDRAESYIGYMTHEICPEEELEKEQRQTMLVASGDMDVVVNVYRENQHVNWCGPLGIDS